jgi:hypothetical protein
VEADPQLLARTFRFAQAHGAHIELVTAKVEKSLLQDTTADLVTFLHGLHLVDTPRALDEAHRLLKPRGKLVAAWNDRNLNDPFIRRLEDLFEKYNPNYSRHSKQRDLEQWKDTLEHGGRFRLEEYAVLPNPLPLPSAVTLLDILDCMSFVRSHMRGARSTEQQAGHASAGCQELTLLLAGLLLCSSPRYPVAPSQGAFKCIPPVHMPVCPPGPVLYHVLMVAAAPALSFLCPSPLGACRRRAQGVQQ